MTNTGNAKTHETILVPLDGGKEDENVLSEAQRIAPGALIHLLHVVPSLTPPTGLPTNLVFKVPEAALAYLEDVRRSLRVNGAEYVRSGDPTEGILNAALELNVHMIAMCTHARRGIARWMLGSVAQSVLRKCSLPVLLTRPGAPQLHGPPKRILVPLSDADTAADVLEMAAPIAQRTGAELVLLHVTADVPDHAVIGGTHPVPLVDDSRRRFLDLAEGLQDRAINAWPVMTGGKIAEAILNQAKELDVDLVAMTTHGVSWLERSLGGSVMASVLPRLNRPLLVKIARRIS